MKKTIRGTVLGAVLAIGAIGYLGNVTIDQASPDLPAGVVLGPTVEDELADPNVVSVTRTRIRLSLVPDASAEANFGALTVIRYSDGTSVLKVVGPRQQVHFYAHLTSADTTAIRNELDGSTATSLAAGGASGAPTNDFHVPLVTTAPWLGSASD